MPLLIDTHPTLSTLSDDLDFSGQWAAWAEADPRIGSIGSLEDARHLRGAQAREAVAALVEPLVVAAAMTTPQRSRSSPCSTPARPPCTATSRTCANPTT